MHAFILAGGFATRLWPLTEQRPKPLLPLAGQPLLTHIISGIPAEIPVTVSTNAVFEPAFRSWTQSIERPVTLNIEPSTHDDVKLGALGAVAHWLDTHGIDDDILLLTGDNYFGFSIASFLSAQTAATALLATYDIGSPEAARQFGTVILHPESTRVRAFVEKPDIPASSLVSTGCSILPRHTLDLVRAFAAVKPDNVGGIFEEFLRREVPVHAYTFRESWFDVGAFHSYMAATSAVAGEGLQAHAEAQIDSATTHAGTVIVGPMSHVRRSSLKDCIIFGHCDIEDCHLERCVIDDHCVLKGVDLAGKMLRSRTVLIAPHANRT